MKIPIRLKLLFLVLVIPALLFLLQCFKNPEETEKTEEKKPDLTYSEVKTIEQLFRIEFPNGTKEIKVYIDRDSLTAVYCTAEIDNIFLENFKKYWEWKDPHKENTGLIMETSLPVEKSSGWWRENPSKLSWWDIHKNLLVLVSEKRFPNNDIVRIYLEKPTDKTFKVFLLAMMSEDNLPSEVNQLFPHDKIEWWERKCDHYQDIIE